MRETDITQFKLKIKDPQNSRKQKILTALKYAGKAALTLGLVFACSMVVVGISLSFYLYGLSTEPTGVDLRARSLKLSSYIYVQDEETKEFSRYQKLYASEDRVWVKFNDIPEAMRNAVIAIEDKRFEEHDGVDWYRTGGAVLELLTGRDNYGGSTITQQLIKNLTSDDDVSLNRKLREIFRALNLEKEYSKQEILEGYLNVVNFGSNTQGVQAAAQLYFNKDIAQCSICECAAIAGITQNPSKWNPLIYPDNNRIRRENVLNEMHSQGLINKEEFDAAMAESAEMTFDNGKKVQNADEEDADEEAGEVQNWYIDMMINELIDDLKANYNLTGEAAASKLYNEGLSIYCAMDTNAQAIIEDAAYGINTSYDPGLLTGATMLDPYTGRVICTASSSIDGGKKSANLSFSCALQSYQPGSSFKPVISYPYAINTGMITYSSVVKDSPMPTYYFDTGNPGPQNWQKKDYWQGDMLVPNAIEQSVNTIPAKLIRDIGAKKAYDQAVGLMGFTHLVPEDGQQLGALSIGAMKHGTTTVEMAAAYAYMINGGRYYNPYTYYYVTDSKDDVILDNRTPISKEAYSEETGTIMNRLLHYNITNCVSTGAWRSRVDGWDIIGKTGSTDYNENVWFAGASPYATMAVWTGLEEYEPMDGGSTTEAILLFQRVMEKYHEGKQHREYELSSNVEELEYCTVSGLLASDGCTSTDEGYYNPIYVPEYCSGHHGSRQEETTGSDGDEPNVDETDPDETVADDTSPAEEDTTPMPTPNPPATE
ncbi:MAG: transglycosylase domain-containing protein [Oscillospiraceae bacterium]|jgi:penicillin-binding protein 1A|nr:transglycosylase domain-containing protein [Oscillospiraceae bacterium]